MDSARVALDVTAGRNRCNRARDDCAHAAGRRGDCGAAAGLRGRPRRLERRARRGPAAVSRRPDPARCPVVPLRGRVRRLLRQSPAGSRPRGRRRDAPAAGERDRPAAARRAAGDPARIDSLEVRQGERGVVLQRPCSVAWDSRDSLLEITGLELRGELGRLGADVRLDPRQPRRRRVVRPRRPDVAGARPAAREPALRRRGRDHHPAAAGCAWPARRPSPRGARGDVRSNCATRSGTRRSPRRRRPG